jgi:hypothetical protein
LECPTPSKPSRRLERLDPASCGQVSARWAATPTSHRYVGEVDIAGFRVLVPPKHRVDGFLEFGATGFVDATSINPDVCIAIF